MGGKDLFIHLATQQTKIFLGHIRNGDETGKLLINELEFTQLHSGLTQPILNRKTPIDFITWTPDTWITNYKLILNKLNGEMTLENTWTPKLLRKHNISLMEFLSSCIKEKETFRIINNC